MKEVQYEICIEVGRFGIAKKQGNKRFRIYDVHTNKTIKLFRNLDKAIAYYRKMEA
ncbi:hypothetical protein FACS1894109_10970 [Spirochaetia bacterium]|nr:hypothetical protein FACS1894109_10970 [Spirochaetia bacterium]